MLRIFLCAVFVAIGYFLFRTAYQSFAVIQSSNDCSPRRLFYQFKQKIWMTTGIGLVYFCIYIAICNLSPLLLDQHNFLDLLRLGQRHPVLFLTAAPLVVILNAILIWA